ncbi:hypothetical protein [Parapedobacter composti]|nr:hypothetical protein [Parapedobacter composti]
MTRPFVKLGYYFATCIIGLALAACGGQSGNTGDSEARSVDAAHTIDTSNGLRLVPGRSVGGIRLDDADSALFRKLGQPDFTNAAMGKAVLMWYIRADTPAHSLSVFTSREIGSDDETARIRRIRVTSPQYETSNGIRVGESLRELSIMYPRDLHIVETYEDDGQQYTIYSTRGGIAFEVDTHNRCVAIFIQKPEASKEPYLPLRGK